MEHCWRCFVGVLLVFASVLRSVLRLVEEEEQLEVLGKNVESKTSEDKKVKNVEHGENTFCESKTVYNLFGPNTKQSWTWGNGDMFSKAAKLLR